MVFLDFPNLDTAPQQTENLSQTQSPPELGAKTGPLPQPNSSSPRTAAATEQQRQELILTRPSLASRAAILTLRRECKQSHRSMGRASRDGICIPSHFNLTQFPLVLAILATTTIQMAASRTDFLTDCRDRVTAVTGRV